MGHSMVRMGHRHMGHMESNAWDCYMLFFAVTITTETVTCWKGGLLYLWSSVMSGQGASVCCWDGGLRCAAGMEDYLVKSGWWTTV